MVPIIERCGCESKEIQSAAPKAPPRIWTEPVEKSADGEKPE